MLELVYRHVSEACVARHESSSLSLGTILRPVGAARSADQAFSPSPWSFLSWSLRFEPKIFEASTLICSLSLVDIIWSTPLASVIQFFIGSSQFPWVLLRERICSSNLTALLVICHRMNSTVRMQNGANYVILLVTVLGFSKFYRGSNNHLQTLLELRLIHFHQSGKMH